jgi:HK97 family phage major capsid protein/HK97 family phage prohead protease
VPWHIESDNPNCSGFAVVKDADGEVEGCHETKADAEKQLAALYASEEDSVTPGGEARAVDSSAWDGNAAMVAAGASDDPAAAFRAICAGRRAGDPKLRETWALPHHKHAGDSPNAAGVRNALSRLPQTEGLTNKEAAQSHLEAHMSQITPSESSARPPRDNLFRSASRPELREVTDLGMPVMSGHLAVFNTWTEIDSMWEGRFLERISPGAFKKTISESKARMRVTFNHGTDPSLGDKVIGPIDVLKEDSEGVYYEVPLLPTSYNRDLEPGLRAGLYGASFRFKVTKDDLVQRPPASDYNPEGLPERTVREVAMYEFGPVTFPAYNSATASVRSLTDDFIVRQLARDPERLRALEQSIIETTPALSPVGAEIESHSDEDGSREEASREAAVEADEARDTVVVVVEVDAGDSEGDDGEGGCGCPDCADPSCQCPGCTDPEGEGANAPADPNCECLGCKDKGSTRSQDEPVDDETAAPEPSERKDGTSSMITAAERRSRQGEIQSRLQEIHAEFGASELPGDIRSEWDNLVAEREENRRAIAEYEERTSQVEEQAKAGAVERVGQSYGATRRGPKLPENIYSVEEYRERAGGDTQTLRRLFRDGAMRSVEDARFAHPSIDNTRAQAHVAKLLDTVDTEESVLARRFLTTGSPTYQRAFGKSLKGSPLTAEEQRALSLGSDPDGGFAVPYQLDPTVILVSDGAVNPIRQIARVEQIVGKEWQGVTSTGITASYDTEATQVSDDSFTLAQPKISTVKAQGFVPFSVELGQDWAGLQSEVARMLADAKDVLEADKFINGTGVNEPNGIVEELDAGSIIETAASNTFAVEDLYSVEEGVPPRFRARGSFMANRSTYNLVRQFDTSGGADLWVRLANSLPSELIGYPSYEVSTMDSGLTDGYHILLFGDFKQFIIVDRIGMSVELIPHIFGANGRPTGQRGIYAIWRNSSEIITDNAFCLLKVKA